MKKLKASLRLSCLLVLICAIFAIACDKDPLGGRSKVSGTLNGEPWEALGEFSLLPDCEWMHVRFAVRNQRKEYRQRVSLYIPTGGPQQVPLYKLYISDNRTGPECVWLTPDTAKASLYRLGADGDVLTGVYHPIIDEAVVNTFTTERLSDAKDYLIGSLKISLAIETPGFSDSNLPDTINLEIPRFEISAQ